MSEWQTVPKQVTPEMEDAHFRAHAQAETVFASVQTIWDAMLAAAPRTPPERNSQPDASGVPKPEMTYQQVLEKLYNSPDPK